MVTCRCSLDSRALPVASPSRQLWGCGERASLGRAVAWPPQLHPLWLPFFSFTFSLQQGAWASPSWGVNRHPSLLLLRLPCAFSEAPSPPPTLPGASNQLLKMASAQLWRRQPARRHMIYKPWFAGSSSTPVWPSISLHLSPTLKLANHPCRAQGLAR